MKKINNIYVGTAEEISPLYKSIDRAIQHGNTGVFNPWCEPARFTPGKFYGLEITDPDEGDGFTPQPEVRVWGENSLLALLLEGGVSYE